MNRKKMKCWEKIVAASVLAAVLMTNSLVAFAHPSVDPAEDAVVCEAECDHLADLSEVELGTGDYAVFVTLDGQVIELKDYQTYVFCLWHNWVDGYFKTHVKDDNGGCTTKSYKAQWCTNCDTIIVGDLSQTLYLVKCNHSY